MPLIEVLPNTTTTNAPGWAYVPDTGYDPSKAPLQPSGSRQRTARDIAVADGEELTVRQQSAIVKHLAELDKDNHRDVQIPIPTKGRDRVGRASKGKATPAKRRIVQSQKTFANHLADEEAHIASQCQPSASHILHPAVQSARKGAKAALSPARRRSSTLTEILTPHAKPSSPATLPPPSRPQTGASVAGPKWTQAMDAADQLLQSHTPPKPPTALLDDLLAAPPLPYAAARSKPSSLGVPQRRFCEICGYWGRVRCRKCSARVCGLECKGIHDEQRCLKFYA